MKQLEAPNDRIRHGGRRPYAWTWKRSRARASSVRSMLSRSLEMQSVMRSLMISGRHAIQFKAWPKYSSPMPASSFGRSSKRKYVSARAANPCEASHAARRVDMPPPIRPGQPGLWDADLFPIAKTRAAKGAIVHGDSLDALHACCRELRVSPHQSKFDGLCGPKLRG
jgi:hypothetical protein